MPSMAATDHLSPVPRRSVAARSTRVRSLRAQARRVNPIVAQAYLRRAAELERTASIRSGRPATEETTLLTGEAPAAA